MPPVQTTNLPTSLIERFCGAAAEVAMRLLAFLSPLSVNRATVADCVALLSTFAACRCFCQTFARSTLFALGREKTLL